MSNMQKRDAGREGASLVAVMSIVLAVSACLGVLATISGNRAYNARKLANRVKAVAIAEAGASQAYALLSTNFNQRTNAAAFPRTAFVDGYYQASVKCVGTNIAVISCTGIVGMVSEYVVLDVQRFPQTNGVGGGGSPAGAYACAIMANGTLSLTGSGLFNVSNGVVHGNSTFSKSGSGGFSANTLEFCGGSTLSGSWTFDSDFFAGGDVSIGGSGQINHNAKAKFLDCSGSFKILGNGTVLTYHKTGSGGVMGTLTTNVMPSVPLITIPNIDLTPYYNCAVANGQVFSNKSISGSSPVQPAGGVMWVNGTLNISGSGNLIGCFIATGNISISGSGSQIKVNNYPALVSRDGNIDISGSQSFHGLIYSKTGSFSKSGSGLVVGSIISGGNFTGSGSWNGLIYEDSTPIPPGTSTNALPDVVSVNAWQR